MKTLVTHINPHLDDIFAIWLFKKFHPEFKNAKLEFLSAKGEQVTYQDQPVDSNPDIVHFGIGRGKFDEHKGDKDECAGSLVWKNIVESGLAPKDEVEFQALEELNDWNKQIDLGRAPTSEFSVFSVQSFIRPNDDSEESSQKAQSLGEEILDRILIQLIDKQKSLKDWEERVEFETKFGKTVAVKSETINRPFVKQQEGDLFLMYDPSKNHVQYFTPRFDLDLEPIYKKVKELDPEADWFLHQSHHMVICGSGAAPDSKKTNLAFEQLVDIIKDI
ncbi:hypothetical protein HYS97_03545 [Candidatus Daviesbacteria bacterium]|nr:hypothetical protein [Candidatus Daviesbacteria bacterium]